MRHGDGRADVIAALGCALAAAPIACFLLLQPAASTSASGDPASASRPLWPAPTPPCAVTAPTSTFALAIEARPSIALAHWLRLCVHGGPSYTWLGATEHPLGQFSGLGLVYGAGLELSIDRMLPNGWLFGLSLWIDQSRQHLDLSSGQGELDGTVDLTLVGMGFSFGS